MLKRQRGFTLIEVVLVLAVVGFVFVIIFAVLSSTGRSRRDEQRKTDLNRIYGALETYDSANSKYPSTVGFGAFWSSSFVTTLDLHDPSTGAVYAAGAGWPEVAAAGTVYYRLGTDCSGVPTANGYSVRMGLEVSEVCRDLK